MHKKSLWRAVWTIFPCPKLPQAPWGNFGHSTLTTAPSEIKRDIAGPIAVYKPFNIITTQNMHKLECHMPPTWKRGCLNMCAVQNQNKQLSCFVVRRWEIKKILWKHLKEVRKAFILRGKHIKCPPCCLTLWYIAFTWVVYPLSEVTQASDVAPFDGMPKN